MVSEAARLRRKRPALGACVFDRGGYLSELSVEKVSMEEEEGKKLKRRRAQKRKEKSKTAASGRGRFGWET